MQFQIACKHCHRLFAIESEAGRTVRCNCPYCGEGMMVVTPGTVPEDGVAGSTAGTGCTGQWTETGHRRKETWMAERRTGAEGDDCLRAVLAGRDTGVNVFIRVFFFDVKLKQ